MISQGQYLMITSFDHLPNQRCEAMDGNKSILYRNNWCINEGDCGTCSIASQYEGFLLEAKVHINTHEKRSEK